MARLPPQTINWGQLQNSQMKDLNFKLDVQDKFTPNTIIMGNDKEDNGYLNEFNLREKEEISRIEREVINYGM